MKKMKYASFKVWRTFDMFYAEDKEREPVGYCNVDFVGLIKKCLASNDIVIFTFENPIIVDNVERKKNGKACVNHDDHCCGAS